MSRIGDVLDLNNEFSTEEVFNVALEMDSRYYLNITQIKYCNIPEFSESYQKILHCFEEILELLQRSNGHDQLFDQAINLLPNGDLNEICLGYSNGAFGKGIGYKTRRLIIERAKAIIDSGVSNPSLFFFTPLFTSGVGADRLSDLIGNIIKSDIYNYTHRIMASLHIDHENYPLLHFDQGYLHHPKYDRKKILFVPESIIHMLPINREYLSVDFLYNDNQSVRNKVNNVVGEAWKNMKTKAKKDVLFEEFKSEEFTSSLITDFDNLPSSPYDFTQDTVGDVFLRVQLPLFLDRSRIEVNTDVETIEQKIDLIISTFKTYIDEYNLKSLIYFGNNKIRDLAYTLRLFQLVSEDVSKNSELELSFKITNNAGTIRVTDNYNSLDIVFRYLSSRSLRRVLKSCAATNQEQGQMKIVKFIVIIDEMNDDKLQSIRDEHADIRILNQYTPNLLEIDIVQ